LKLPAIVAKIRVTPSRLQPEVLQQAMVSIRRVVMAVL
jgi:hypothetical protein